MIKKTTSPKKNGILFFIKYPNEGKVKSRLAKDLPPTLITSLYRCFVKDLLTMLKKTNIPLIICYEPPQYKPQFQQWLGKEYVYQPQIGKTLGERLSNAFKNAFNLEYTNLLVIGSDSPDLNETFIHTTFQQLETFDTVIGPSSDGGYYLLALQKDTYSPAYFRNIKWSSSTVFQKTSQNIRKAGRTIYTLPIWFDIDNYADLTAFYKRNLQTSYKDSSTMQILINHFKKDKNNYQTNLLNI